VDGIIRQARHVLCIGTFSTLARAQEANAIGLKAPEIELWPNGTPGSENVTAKEEWIPTTDGLHRVRNMHQLWLCLLVAETG
jgi:hypothetical protein